MYDTDTEPVDYENDILPYIKDASIVPVVSNSFRLEQIFRDDQELLDLMLKNKIEFYDEAYTIDQQLTKAWSASTKYPMSDDHNLARVAQYRQIVLGESEKAKREYLNFFKERLLKINRDKQGYEDLIAYYQQQKHLQRPPLTKMARELDLPTAFPEGKPDPLLLLARLPLPVYITTSYFTFLEEALVKADKMPSTQVWSWGEPKATINQEHEVQRTYKPSIDKPAVYHLFGLENYVRSLVLSEDDYMNFLIESASGKSSNELFPEPLQKALSADRLLLLGYHVRNWDFRVLFRFILEFRKTAVSPESIALQFKLMLENKASEETALSYLEKYFGKNHFNVKWIDAERFIYELTEAR